MEQSVVFLERIRRNLTKGDVAYHHPSSYSFCLCWSHVCNQDEETCCFWSMLTSHAFKRFMINKGDKKVIAIMCVFSQAFWNVREETPCRSLTNPKKLSFPSECLIQSWSTTWIGTEGLRPSSWNKSNCKSFRIYMC